MNRLCPLLLVFCLVAACGGLPKIQPGLTDMQMSMPDACRAVYPVGKWQFVHSIEASFPAGENLLMGVTVVDAAAGTIDCALMTLEGFVLFRAQMGKTIRVDRAMPPFDRQGFASGLLEDIRLIFLMPASGAPRTGRLAGGGSSADKPVCRYTDDGGITTDVMPGADSQWQLRRYNPQGCLTRTVAAESNGGQADFPGRMRLTAHGLTGYTLTMKLVKAVRFND